MKGMSGGQDAAYAAASAAERCLYELD